MSHPARPAQPFPLRALVSATSAAVAAAAAQDADEFRAATTRLSAADPEQVRLLLGQAVRTVLEDRHPDGLDADDVQLALRSCLSGTTTWWPGIDVGALIVVATGALGVHDSQGTNDPVTPGQVAIAAPLLLATLLAGAPRPLEAHLADAVAEMARAQTVEMP